MNLYNACALVYAFCPMSVLLYVWAIFVCVYFDFTGKESSWEIHVILPGGSQSYS